MNINAKRKIKELDIHNDYNSKKEVYTKPHTKKYKFKSVNNSFNLDDETNLDIELDAVSKIIPIGVDIYLDPNKKIKRTNSCEATKVNFDFYKEEEENEEARRKIEDEVALLKRENKILQTQNLDYRTKLSRNKKSEIEGNKTHRSTQSEIRLKKENEELKKIIRSMEDEIKNLNELLIKANKPKKKKLKVVQCDRFKIIHKKITKSIHPYNSTTNLKKNNSTVSQKSIQFCNQPKQKKKSNKISAISTCTKFSSNDNKQEDINEIDIDNLLVSHTESNHNNKHYNSVQTLNKVSHQEQFYSPSMENENIEDNFEKEDFFEDYPLSPPKIQENSIHRASFRRHSIDDKMFSRPNREENLQKEIEEVKPVQIPPNSKKPKEKASLIMSVLNDNFSDLLCQGYQEPSTQRAKQNTNSVEKFLTNNNNHKQDKVSKYLKRK